MADFKKAFDHIITVEGSEFTNHPLDRGGPTKWGITQETLSTHYKRPASLDEIKNLSKETAQEIYKKKYWDSFRLDEVKSDLLAMVIFDQSVNRGTYAITNQIQIALNSHYLAGLINDGVFGNKTFEWLNRVNGVEFSIILFKIGQLAYLNIVKKNPSQLIFISGWINRTHVLLDLILKEIKNEELRIG